MVGHGDEGGSGGSVTGTVVNGSGVVIKDGEVMVSHAWSWSDERHPGEDNPGGAGYVRVIGEFRRRARSGSFPLDP